MTTLGAVGRVAQRAAGIVARRGNHLQDNSGQRKRDQHEIMAGDTEAKTGIRHDHRQHGGSDHRDGNAEPWRHAEMVPQQRRHISANAHEAAMPQRDQAEPAHHRPRRIGKRPDQDQDQDVQVVGFAIDERQRDQRRTGNPGHQLTCVHERLANSPAGLMNIMTMKKAKAST